MPRQTGQAERRRHARVQTRVPFHLVADGKDEPFDLVDLSESGVRIRSPRGLVPMTRIRVRVVLPAKKVGTAADVALDTTGVVVWSHKERGPGGFDVGVFFSDLEDRQRNLLRTFVGAHA